MNKLASIYYLQAIGLPTIDPEIITTTDESKLIRVVNSFYHKEEKWVLRCGGLPDKNASLEIRLPWDIAENKEELMKKILNLQKEVRGKYNVFLHGVRNMERGASMLIEGYGTIIEAARGGPRELSKMFRGTRDPEQFIKFNPGMLAYTSSGKEVLTQEDLYDARKIERIFSWSELDTVSNPFRVEWSRLDDGRLYVHDFEIVG